MQSTAHKYLIEKLKTDIPNLKTRGFRQNLEGVVRDLDNYESYVAESGIKEGDKDWSSKQEFYEFQYQERGVEDFDFVPDGYVFVKIPGGYEIHFYEVEITHLIKESKLRAIGSFADINYYDINTFLHIIDRFGKETVFDTDSLMPFMMLGLAEGYSLHEICARSSGGI